MAYNPVPATQVTTWLATYKRLHDTDLPNAASETERERIERRMTSLAITVQRRLNTDIQIVRGYLTQHLANANQWAAEAQEEIKHARSTAASYRKNPNQPGLPPQLQHMVNKLGGLETAIDDDGNDYGQAWFQYRGLTFNTLPEQYSKTFLDTRKKMMNDAKIIATKRETILAAKHEAEGLVQILAKAKMKQGIKQKTGTQRLIGVAQQEARNLAGQAAALYQVIVMPIDASSPPQSIATSANSLEKNAALKTWYQTPSNLETARGQWKSIEAAYKNLTVKTAGLEKTVAVKKRAFRSNELSDPVVKVEVAKAEKNVKDAKKLVAQYKSGYSKGQKAFAKMEATFKKKK